MSCMLIKLWHKDGVAADMEELQKLLRDIDPEALSDTQDGFKALDKVNLSVAPGEVVGLVGESGSGKSVSAMSIMGLVPTPPGRIVGGVALIVTLLFH